MNTKRLTETAGALGEYTAAMETPATLKAL